MFTLKSRQDGFRLLFPKDFLVDSITEKYQKILVKKHSFITEPIDFINETIQAVQVLGFTEGTFVQPQTGRGTYSEMQSRIAANRFLHTATDNVYRSEVSPLQLMDKTLNVTFRHTLGFLNYFIIFENFWELYKRDYDYDEMIQSLNIDIMNEHGTVYSRICLYQPIMDTMDMLDLNYTQPVAQSQTFQCTFKYSNFDFQFIEEDEVSGDLITTSSLYTPNDNY